MYGVTITTPASAPITAATFRAWLRLNDTAEDTTLDELLGAAVERFEADTGRPVLTTIYRQDLTRWPIAAGWPSGYQMPWHGQCYPGQIVLGRGGVTAVGAVKQYAADGNTTTISSTLWRADLLTPPARVTLASIPAPITTAAGVPVTPVGCVEFTAGWANTAATPKAVLVALKLLAAHWYENREAHREGDLKELPDGWRSVVAKYKTGLTGDWGQ